MPGKIEQAAKLSNVVPQSAVGLRSAFQLFSPAATSRLCAALRQFGFRSQIFMCLLEKCFNGHSPHSIELQNCPCSTTCWLFTCDFLYFVLFFGKWTRDYATCTPAGYVMWSCRKLSKAKSPVCSIRLWGATPSQSFPQSFDNLCTLESLERPQKSASQPTEHSRHVDLLARSEGTGKRAAAVLDRTCSHGSENVRPPPSIARPHIRLHIWLALPRFLNNVNGAGIKATWLFPCIMLE